MVELFSNSGDLDQTPASAASDLGMHCLPLTRLGIFSFWVNTSSYSEFRDQREKQNLVKNNFFNEMDLVIEF